MAAIILYLRQPDGGLTPIELSPDATCADLYAAADQQLTLTHGGKPIPNDSTPLADTGLSNESALETELPYVVIVHHYYNYCLKNVFIRRGILRELSELPRYDARHVDTIQFYGELRVNHFFDAGLTAFINLNKDTRLHVMPYKPECGNSSCLCQRSNDSPYDFDDSDSDGS